MQIELSIDERRIILHSIWNKQREFETILENQEARFEDSMKHCKEMLDILANLEYKLTGIKK